MSEVDLAAVVAEHFRVRGYAVFQEVNLGNRCDLVARLHRLAYAIEVKQHANLAVLAQAARHVGHAHGVYVAVPPKPVSGWPDFIEVAAALGVGVLSLQDAPPPLSCHEVGEARITRWLHPKRETWLRATLTPEHQALGGVAGDTASQAAWTGFKQFQKEVWQTLRREGPLTVAQLATKLREDAARWSSYRWSSDALARRALHGYASKNLLPCIAYDDGYPKKLSAIGTEFRAA